MQHVKRFMTSMGGIAVIAAAVAIPMAQTAAATPDPRNQQGPSVVPFSTTDRMCDFHVAKVPMPGDGTGFALISTAGNKVRAEVHLQSADPDTRHTARLILMPRSGADSCAAGAPGTVVAPLDTDGAGNAVMTLEQDIAQGATGAWVLIEGPPRYGKPYGQIYTSDFVATI